ncbi:MAG: hypothetical protein D6712_13525 [Chloroflexi bacterium]|nr:MAG: hypothetical protein D6712_13525 [Chloroflexota bacterium]
MSTENFRDIFSRALQRTSKLMRQRGLIGDGRGNVFVDGHPNRVYIRLQKNDRIELTSAWCYKVTPAYGLPVWVIRNANDELVVDDFDLHQATGYYDGTLRLNTSGLHAVQHYWGQNDPIYLQSIQVGGAQVLPATGLALRTDTYVQRTLLGAYVVHGTTLDVSAYVPSALNQQRVIVVGIDIPSASYSIVAGDVQVIGGVSVYQNPFSADDAARLIPTTMHPLAAYRLRTGQTQLNVYDFIVDLRQKTEHSCIPVDVLQITINTDGTQIFIEPYDSGSIALMNAHGDVYGTHISTASTVDLSVVPANTTCAIGVDRDGVGTYYVLPDNTLQHISDYYYVTGTPEIRVVGACHLGSDGTIYDTYQRAYVQRAGHKQEYQQGTIAPYTRNSVDTGTTRYVPNGTLELLNVFKTQAFTLTASVNVSQSTADATFELGIVGLTHTVMMRKETSEMFGVAQVNASGYLEPNTALQTIYFTDTTSAALSSLQITAGGISWKR